ncbi:hypothetical protein AB0A74_07415 [Saccharothrix sp. NPDC042600]|uniref:hypothetical protein n=1 Tax=Saccharothrix TaxID=2071 RepID=UPI0033E0DE54|nr:hypothetical protein GCM10017745_29920 [Saccharothrix mutabilis subsp. capreolus]
MTDYRGLGFDPTPGDAEAVAAVSRRCALGVDVPVVPAGWSGAAAEGLAARWEAVVSELAAVRRAMRAAAEVLDAWAGELLGNRRRAEELDARAVRLRRQLADAADEVDHTGALASFTPAHGEAHAAAVARHDDLARRLEEVLAEARSLERDHHAAARRVAERLRETEAAHAGTPVDVSGPAARGGFAETLAGFSVVAEELASVLFGGRTLARPPAPDSIVPSGTDKSGAAAFLAGLG